MLLCMTVKGEAQGKRKWDNFFGDNHLLGLLEIRRGSESHGSKELLQVQRPLS